MYLADAAGVFRLLAFDFDAKDGGDAAARDTGTLAQLLDAAGIEHVVCVSGPSGGRHVWVAVADGVDASTAGSLARLTAALCPSLDVAPLSNPATGCVRPPGAPHRDGGASTVLAGDVSVLSVPSTTAEKVRALVSRIAGLVSASTGETARAGTGRLPRDAGGHRYLPGPARPLPAASRAALEEDAAAGDASSVLRRVLLGAAAARWRHADLAALVPAAAGLEHLRTLHARGQRVRRPMRGPQSTVAVLARQWDKAVAHVAVTARRAGDDSTFDTRAGDLASHVRELQVRADAARGRWTRGGGPTDRRVLDVLCALALQAMTADVEADIRRLALTAGIGRETARTALTRLAADGWITRTQVADGPHGAHWTIDPHCVLHRVSSDSRSQADPRPAGVGSAERTVLLHAITARTTAAAHDVFTPSGGLGHAVGNVYARTATTSTDLDDLSRATGHSPVELLAVLGVLQSAGLVRLAAASCVRTADQRRDGAAVRLSVAGRLAARRRAYQLERDVWAWWQAEHDWMIARGTHRARRRAAHQVPLWRSSGTDAYPKHPRTPAGRADYHAARTAVAAGALDQSVMPARAPLSAAA